MAIRIGNLEDEKWRRTYSSKAENRRCAFAIDIMSSRPLKYFSALVWKGVGTIFYKNTTNDATPYPDCCQM